MLLTDYGRMAFDWRSVIKIDRAFSPAERARIEQSLQQIVDTGSEGIELLTKAAKLQGGAITIWKTTKNGSNVGTRGALNINLKHADSVTYVENDIPRPASLTGLLVHEIYHMGDPRFTELQSTPFGSVRNYNDFGQFGAKLQQTFSNLGVEEQQQKALLQELDTKGIVILKDFAGMQSPYDRHSLQEELGKLGYKNLGKLIAEHGLEALRKAGYEAGLMDNRGQMYWEHDAVQFTDQWMRKHFGDSEPWRGDYSNGLLISWGGAAMPTPVSGCGHAGGCGCARPAVDGFAAPAHNGIEPPKVNSQFAHLLDANGVCWVTSAGPDRFPTSHMKPEVLTTLPSPPRPVPLSPSHDAPMVGGG